MKVVLKLVNLIMLSPMYLHASCLTSCSVYENEKVRVGQASEKVHPYVVLMPSLTLWSLSMELTFSATQASPGACNPSLLFMNAFII
jgi:hypothetical protein